MDAHREFPKHLRIASIYNISNPKYYLTRRLIEYLSVALQFSYEMQFSNDQEYGRPLEDGTWTGVVGMVQRGESDIIFDPMAFTEERSKVVTFSYPFTFTYPTFVTNKPKVYRDRLAVVNAFTRGTWITLGLTFFIVNLTMYLFLRKRSVKVNLFPVLGSVLLQPISFSITKRGERLLMLSWFIGVMIIATSYKAVYFSFHTLPSNDAIRTIPQLVKSVEKGTHRCKALKGSFFINTFLKSSDPSIRIIGQSMLENSANPFEGEEFLKMHPNVGVYLTGKDEARILSKKYFTSNYGFFTVPLSSAFKKNFCCQSTLDKVTIRMFERGIYDKIKDDFITLSVLKIKIEDGETDKTAPLTLEDFYAAFIILLCGYVLGILTFLIELYSSK